jgi:hypothetical protein
LSNKPNRILQVEPKCQRCRQKGRKSHDTSDREKRREHYLDRLTF